MPDFTRLDGEGEQPVSEEFQRSRDHATGIGSVTSEQLADLIAQVEAAKGPERLLDALLWDLEDPRPRVNLGWEDAVWKRDPQDSVAFDSAPHFTTSLDEAMRLIGRMLPGWSWTAGDIQRDDGKGGSWAVLYDVGRVGHSASGSGKGMFASAPLALIAALLSALQAQASEGGQ